MESRLAGLPEYGVLLTGTPENPILENRSGRAVIAYRLKKAGQNGHGPAPLMFLAFSGQPAGIPDGGSVHVPGNVPVKPVRQGHGIHSVPILSPMRPVPGPTVSATLHSVVFGDGQFVGDEEEWIFEQFGRVIKVIRELGLLAKTGAWDQLEAVPPMLAPPGGEESRTYIHRRVAAERLVETRKQSGDAAAGQLADIYSALPTAWK